MAATNEIINLLLNVRTEVTDTQSFKAFAATFKANLTDLEKQAKESGAGIEAAFNHIDALLKKPGVTSTSFLKGLNVGTEAEKFNTIVNALIQSKEFLAQSFEKSINVNAFLESLNKLSDLRTVLNIDFGKTPKAKIDEAFSVLSAALKSNIEGFANEQIGFDQLFEKLFSAGPKTNIAKGITSTFNLIKEDIQKGIVDVNNLTTDDRLNIIQKLEAKLNQGLTKSTVLHTYAADLEFTKNLILAILEDFYTRDVIPPQDFFKEFRTGLKASGALAKTELEKILNELTAINPQLAGDQKFLTNLLKNLGFKPTDIDSFFKTAESTLIKQLENLNNKLKDAGTLNTAGFVSNNLVDVRKRLNELTSQEKLKTLIDPTVAEALKVANAELNLFGTTASQTFAQVSNFEKGLKQLIGSIDTSTAFGAAFKPLLESYLNFEGNFRLGQAFQNAGDVAVNTISGIEKRLADLSSNSLKLNLQPIQEGTFRNGEGDVSANAFKLKDEAANKYQKTLDSLTDTIKTVEERLLVLNSIDPKSISDAQATQRNALLSDYGKILEQLNIQITENKASFDGWNATWKKASESSDFATNAVNQFYKSLDSGKTAGYIASTLEVGAGFLKFAQDAGQASSSIDGVFANFLKLDGNTKATVETLQRAKAAIVDLFADQGKLGAIFPLADFGSSFDVPASLKTKIIELADGGKAANEQYTKLIELANTLNTIQAGGTSFGKQVTALADLARGAQDFKDSLKLAQVSGETASTAVSSLNTNYEHLLSLVDKYNKVKDSKEPTDIKAAEDALKAIEAQYRKVTRAVDTTTERVEFLKTAQSLLKGNVNFASDASLASLSYFDIELNRTSAAIVKLADDIKLLKGLEPSINFDAITSNAKNSRKTLEDVFEGLRTTLAGKLNGILDGIKIEGLPQSFGNDLRTQFDNILASLRSGDFSTALTQINGLFKALEETFKNQTATVSGAEAVEKLVTPWRALAGELGTSLDNAVKVIAEKVPQLNKTFAGDANSKAITEEFALIQTAADSAKKTIGSFNETVNSAGKQNLLAGLESVLANLQIKLTALKDTGITPTDFATFQSDLKTLQSEINKNKDLLKSVSEVKFNTLLADTKQLSDNFKQASTLNSGGLTNTLDVLDARFNSLRGTIASTGNVLQEVFNKGYGGEQLIKFDSKTLEGLGAKIREALSAATKGSAEESALIALEARWKSLTEAAGQYNAVQSFAKSGNLAANAVHDTQALADLETRITGLTSSFAQYQRELQTAAQNTNLTATQAADLAKSFKIVQDGTQNTTAEIGILRNSASGLSSVLGKLKEAGGQNTDGYKWLDDIRLKINEIVKSKLALDDRFKNGFIGNIEADLNRLIQARTAIEQVANIGKNFGNQDYLNITASSAKNAVNEIQRLGTTLNKLKGDLEKSLAVPKLTQLDPVLETQLRSQLVQVELNAKALKEYQAVYEQLQSGLKIEAFEKLRNTITQATESAISSRQGVSDYSAAMRDAAQQAVLLATSLKLTQTPLSNEFVEKFKQQSDAVNTLRKDAEGYLNLLKALKDANVVSLPWGPVDASGKAATVTIAGLITVFQDLLNVSTAASKPLSETAQILETRLGTAAGQAELKINSLASKIQDLQAKINGLSPGSGLTETYGSIRQILALLEKPIPQTPFFTLPKEEFSVFRNELSSALKIAQAAAEQLGFALHTTYQQDPLNTLAIKQGEDALKAAQKTITELTRGMQQLSEAEKQSSKFSGLQENLHGAATNLTSLAHEGAFLYKGLEKLFDALGRNIKPKIDVDTTELHNQIQAIQKEFGLTNTAAAELKKNLKDSLNTNLGNGTVAAAAQHTAAFEELEKAFVKFHSGLSQAAMGFQMLGDSLLEPFKKAKENFEQFSDTMGMVSAVTNATTSQFAALTTQALLMGATTRFTSEQAAEALKELSKAGFTAEQQIASLPAVMRLAQAAGTELASAAQIATVVMNEFRMEPEQFTQASDAIALAANRTLASVEDLGFAFKYVGALASNIGADFNELTASIAILHNAGMKGCYDDQTEILTRSGFKLFKDLAPDVEVMTINKDSLEMEWQLPEGHYAFTIDEPMARIKSRYIDLLVTDNHRLLIETRSGHTKIVEARDFKEGYFYRTGIWKGTKVDNFVLKGFVQDRGNWDKVIEDLEIPIELWAQFLGWYLAEGSLCYNKGSYTVAITQSKGNRIDEIRELLTKLPFNFNYDGSSFRIVSQQLYQELESYGKGFNNKRVPEYIKELDVDNLKIFLEHFRRGDGDVQYNLYTSNKALSEDLYEVALKCGYGVQSKIVGLAGDQKKIGERTITATQDAHLISISTKHTKPFFSVSEYARHEKVKDSYTTGFEWVPYKGQVFSVSVPNGLVFVRRNGFGLFCGNTMAGTALRGILSALHNPTKDETLLLENLSERIGGAGLRIADTSGKFLGFGRILEQLEQAGITTGEVLRLFGQRAGPGMAALLAQGSEAVSQLEADLKNAEGTTAHMAEIMENTLKGKLLLMRSSLQALSDQVGHNLSGALMLGADALGDFISKFVALRETFPTLSKDLDIILSAVALVASVLGGLAVSYAFVLVPVRQFVAFMRTYATVALAGAAAITTTTGAIALNARTTGTATKAIAAKIYAEITAQRQAGVTLAAINVDTIARGINTDAILANAAAQTAATAAATRLVGAQAAQIGLWAGLKGILTTLGGAILRITPILKFAFATPIGLAITATTALVAATYAHGKSVEQSNEELEKQSQILEYSRKEAEQLTIAISRTSDSIKKNQAELASLKAGGGNEEQIFKVEVAIDTDKQKLTKQLQEFYTRLTQETSQFKDKLNFDIGIDSEGNFDRFIVTLKDGSQSIDVFAEGVANAGVQLDKLRPLLNAASQKQKEFIAAQQLGNISDDLLGTNQYQDPVVSGTVAFVKDFFGFGSELAKGEEKVATLKRLVAQYEQIRDQIKDGQAFDASYLPLKRQGITNFDDLANFVAGLKNELSVASIGVNESYEKLTEAQTASIEVYLKSSKAEISRMADLEPLLRMTLTKIYADNGRRVSPEFIDQSVKQLALSFKNLKATITDKELSGIELKLPFNAISSSLGTLSTLIGESNKAIGAALKEQRELFKGGEDIAKHVKTYRDAFKTSVEDLLKIDIDTSEFNLEAKLAEQLTGIKSEISAATSSGKVLEFPINIKPETGNFTEAQFKAIKSFGNELLSYEKTVNAELRTASIKSAEAEYNNKKQQEENKRALIEQSTQKLAAEYDKDSLAFKAIEKEKQAALSESWKKQYEVSANYLEKLQDLRLKSEEKSRELAKSRVEFEDTINKSERNFNAKISDDLTKIAQERVVLDTLKAQIDASLALNTTEGFDQADALLKQRQTVIDSIISSIESPKKLKLTNLAESIKFDLTMIDFEAQFAKANLKIQDGLNALGNTLNKNTILSSWEIDLKLKDPVNASSFAPQLESTFVKVRDSRDAMQDLLTKKLEDLEKTGTGAAEFGQSFAQNMEVQASNFATATEKYSAVMKSVTGFTPEPFVKGPLISGDSYTELEATKRQLTQLKDAFENPTDNTIIPLLDNTSFHARDGYIALTDLNGEVLKYKQISGTAFKPLKPLTTDLHELETSKKSVGDFTSFIQTEIDTLQRTTSVLEFPISFKIDASKGLKTSDLKLNKGFVAEALSYERTKNERLLQLQIGQTEAELAIVQTSTKKKLDAVEQFTERSRSFYKVYHNDVTGLEVTTAKEFVRITQDNLQDKLSALQEEYSATQDTYSKLYALRTQYLDKSRKAYEDNIHAQVRGNKILEDIQLSDKTDKQKQNYYKDQITALKEAATKSLSLGEFDRANAVFQQMGSLVEKVVGTLQGKGDGALKKFLTEAAEEYMKGSAVANKGIQEQSATAVKTIEDHINSVTETAKKLQDQILATKNDLGVLLKSLFTLTETSAESGGTFLKDIFEQQRALSEAASKGQQTGLADEQKLLTEEIKKQVAAQTEVNQKFAESSRILSTFVQAIKDKIVIQLGFDDVELKNTATSFADWYTKLVDELNTKEITLKFKDIDSLAEQIETSFAEIFRLIDLNAVGEKLAKDAANIKIELKPTFATQGVNNTFTRINDDIVKLKEALKTTEVGELVSEESLTQIKPIIDALVLSVESINKDLNNAELSDKVKPQIQEVLDLLDKFKFTGGLDAAVKDAGFVEKVTKLLAALQPKATETANNVGKEFSEALSGALTRSLPTIAAILKQYQDEISTKGFNVVDKDLNIRDVVRTVIDALTQIKTAQEKVTNRNLLQEEELQKATDLLDIATKLSARLGETAGAQKESAKNQEATTVATWASVVASNKEKENKTEVIKLTKDQEAAQQKVTVEAAKTNQAFDKGTQELKTTATTLSTLVQNYQTLISELNSQPLNIIPPETQQKFKELTERLNTLKQELKVAADSNDFSSYVRKKKELDEVLLQLKLLGVVSAETLKQFEDLSNTTIEPKVDAKPAVAAATAFKDANAAAQQPFVIAVSAEELTTLETQLKRTYGELSELKNFSDFELHAKTKLESDSTRKQLEDFHQRAQQLFNDRLTLKIDDSQFRTGVEELNTEYQKFKESVRPVRTTITLDKDYQQGFTAFSNELQLVKKQSEEIGNIPLANQYESILNRLAAATEKLRANGNIPLQIQGKQELNKVLEDADALGVYIDETSRKQLRVSVGLTDIDQVNVNLNGLNEKLKNTTTEQQKLQQQGQATSDTLSKPITIMTDDELAQYHLNDVSEQVKALDKMDPEVVLGVNFSDGEYHLNDVSEQVKALDKMDPEVVLGSNLTQVSSDLTTIKNAFNFSETAGFQALIAMIDTVKAKISEVANQSIKPVDLKFGVTGAEEATNKATSLSGVLLGIPPSIFSTLNVLVDEAKAGISSVKSMLDSIPNNTEKTITVKYETQGTPPMQSRNKGGIIGSIQHFAEGGLAKFKELANSFVPGAGNTDTVPAMLTPGEFVIKKDRVQELGVGFLNALNSGLIQFKSMGGMIANAPMNTLNAMSSYTQPQYKLPQQEAQTAGGPSVNINLTIKDKKFNIKTPRDQVDGLVSAFKQLNRTL